MESGRFLAEWWRSLRAAAPIDRIGLGSTALLLRRLQHGRKVTDWIHLHQNKRSIIICSIFLPTPWILSRYLTKLRFKNGDLEANLLDQAKWMGKTSSLVAIHQNDIYWVDNADRQQWLPISQQPPEEHVLNGMPDWTYSRKTWHILVLLRANR